MRIRQYAIMLAATYCSGSAQAETDPCGEDCADPEMLCERLKKESAFEPDISALMQYDYLYYPWEKVELCNYEPQAIFNIFMNKKKPAINILTGFLCTLSRANEPGKERYEDVARLVVLRRDKLSGLNSFDRIEELRAVEGQDVSKLGELKAILSLFSDPAHARKDAPKLCAAKAPQQPPRR